MLISCPLVAQDDKVVLVDATVRLAVRQATDDKDLVLGYNPAEEIAVHAVSIVVLRLMADGVPSDELLVGRARVTEALEQGLASHRSTQASKHACRASRCVPTPQIL